VSLDGVFREASSTVEDEAPTTRPTLRAVGREFDVKGAVSLDGAFREVSTSAA